MSDGDNTSGTSELILPSQRQRSKSMLITIILSSTLFVAVFSGVLLVKLPLYTYEAEKQSYSQAALAKSASAEQMTESEREAIRKQYGIDFSQLLVPEAMESTDIMRTVADTCMPHNLVTNLALPQTAHETFTLASDYLACAIVSYTDRFCQEYHRHRLVEQLLAYLDIRQQMIAMEMSRIELLKKRYTSRAQDASWRKIYPRIDNDLDHRIGNGLIELIHHGYISSLDFGWQGIILPRKYAPFLDEAIIEVNHCS